jgi:hypothetical protein
MAAKLLISISAERATATVAQNGKLAPCQSFTNNDAGTRAFDRYLQSYRNVPVHVMVDAVEEDYRFELLPHASGRDRAELLDRRLRQLYRNTSFCAALAQGREAGKRRDDQYLFCALVNPDVVAGWLAIVRAHELPVAGVYLLPVIAEHLVQKFAVSAHNLLLVSRHPSGLRLTFFRDGKLRIGRLAQVEIADPRASVAAYTEEIANTRLYLHALRVMTLDEHLAVLVLDRDGTLAALEQAVPREISNAQATIATSVHLTTRANVPESVVRDAPEALYLQFLASHSGAGNLAPAQITERYEIYQLRRSLYATAGIVGLATLGWTGLNAYQIYDLREQQFLAQSQTADYQRRYQEVTRRFPAAPTSADNLVQSIQTAERLKTSKRTPQGALVSISRTLEQFPDVQLKSVGWRYGTKDFQTDAGAKRAEAAPTPAPPQPGGVSARNQSGYIEAEINPFQGDYRAALDTINRFAEALKQDPGVAAVQIATLPLNVSSNTALAGSTTDSPTQATSAPFRLHVLFKATL